jgi:hypothetical protein
MDIIKIIKNDMLPEDMIKEELYDICDSVHASCNNECPVYELNGSKAPDSANDYNVNLGCDCFKHGGAMLSFIKQKLAENE